MDTLIKAGIRPSLLALTQVKEIQSFLPAQKFELIPIDTKGDKDKKTALILRENSDFFTYEIEQALLKGQIDIAIHSAKDLEEDPPQGLVVAAITKAVSRFDCLVSHDNGTLDTLSPSSRIGTSSRNRKEGIKKYRKDLIVKDIRGNIDERLTQLDRGDFEAVIIAHAALIRLGLESRIAQIIPFDIIEPHPLQGRLAVQIRKDRTDLGQLFGRINNA